MQQNGLMKQLSSMSTKITNAQKVIQETEFDGVSGGGLVKVKVRGDGETRRIDLDAAVKNEDLETVGDLIAAALNDANKNKEAFSKQKLAEATGGKIPLGLLKMPGFN